MPLEAHIILDRRNFFNILNELSLAVSFSSFMRWRKVVLDQIVC
jgi:hypothetical protein